MYSLAHESLLSPSPHFSSTHNVHLTGAPRCCFLCNRSTKPSSMHYEQYSVGKCPLRHVNYDLPIEHPQVFNSLSQSPCTVAGYLGSLCSLTGTRFPWNLCSSDSMCHVGKQVIVPPLTPGNHYLGPNVQNSNNACKCSSVFYSMLAACSICQSRNYLG